MNATLRKTGALLGKDLTDLVKNPTVLISCLMPVAAVLLYSKMGGDLTGAAAEARLNYLLSAGLCITAALVGSMTVLNAIAEEKEKHTLRTLMLANVSAEQMVVSRVIVSLLAIVVVDAACFLVARAPLGLLPDYLIIGLLGSIPIVMISLLLGLAARDQMTAGLYSFPIIILAFVPMFASMNEVAAQIAPFFPTGSMQVLVQLSSSGTLFTSEAMQPLVVTLAWIVATVVLFAVLYKRLARDN